MGEAVMTWMRVAVAKLRGLLGMKQLGADAVEEFEHHIELETRKHIAAGVDAAEARRRAVIAFGGIDRHVEAMRDGGAPRWIPDTWQDVKYAFRAMSQHRLYAIVVCVTLALGIALNSSLFSIFDGYMFRGLPFEDTDRIVVLGAITPAIQLPHEMDVQDYAELHRERSTFENLAGYVMETGSLSTSERAERVSTIQATAEYFDVYRARAALGRTFQPADEAPGAPEVIVLSHGAWQRMFAGAASIIGRTAKLNGRPVTIVGVMPESFDATNPLLRIDAYSPLRGIEREFPQRGLVSINVIGRLARGVSVERAGRVVSDIARRIAMQFPTTNANLRMVVVPEAHSRPVLAIAAQTRRAGYAFLALGLLVLVIASVNVTNMTLARAITRQQEFAVRASLGASRWRVTRQLIAEMGVLSLIGGLTGMILASLAMHALSSIHLATDVPLKIDFTPTVRVYFFTLAITLFTMVLTALVPALQSSGVRLSEVLGGAGRGGIGEPRRRLRSTLVVAQIAASVVVLSAAAVFYRSALNAQRMPLGFRTDHILLAATDAESVQYDVRQAARFYDALRARVVALPGVRGVAYARRIPFGYNNSFIDLDIEGREARKGEERPTAFYNNVSPSYFTTLGIPRIAGRDFTVADSAGAPRVAIVTEALAQRFWPGATAVGRRFRTSEDTIAFTVVGVVRNSKYFSMGEAPREFVYLPMTESASVSRILHVWTATDPAAVAPAIRNIVHDLDAAMPLYDVWTMQQHLQFGRALYFMRLGAMITGALGILALFLCMVGLYGVVAYSVTRRTRELGVRIAFGAGRLDVLRLVAGRSMMLTAIGLSIGVALAFGVTQLVGPLLIGVAPVPSLAAAALVLLTVSSLATLLPALRAMRVEPTLALRSD
jgi:predicted permease